MNLADVMDEVADKVRVLLELSVFAYPVDTITPPGGVVGYPEEFDYGQSYQNGVATIIGLPLWIVAGKADAKSARERVSRWTATRGEGSVFQLLDSDEYTSCDSITVTQAKFEVYTVASIDYVTAVFSLNAIGEGN